MAPHRAQSASAVSPETWALLAALGSIVTGLHVVAAAVLLGTMTLDIVTGTRRARRSDTERYHPDTAVQGMKRKAMRLTLILLCLSIDAMGVVIAQFAVRLTGVAPGWIRLAGMGWLTGLAIVWLWYLEALSVSDNLRRREGDTVLFPGFLAALRIVDTMLWRARYGTAADVPARRHVDVALADAHGLGPTSDEAAPGSTGADSVSGPASADRPQRKAGPPRLPPGPHR